MPGKAGASGQGRSQEGFAIGKHKTLTLNKHGANAKAQQQEVHELDGVQWRGSARQAYCISTVLTSTARGSHLHFCRSETGTNDIKHKKLSLCHKRGGSEEEGEEEVWCRVHPVECGGSYTKPDLLVALHQGLQILHQA